MRLKRNGKKNRKNRKEQQNECNLSYLCLRYLIVPCFGGLLLGSLCYVICEGFLKWFYWLLWTSKRCKYQHGNEQHADSVLENTHPWLPHGLLEIETSSWLQCLLELTFCEKF
jgi:hypothetical protein